MIPRAWRFLAALVCFFALASIIPPTPSPGPGGPGEARLVATPIATERQGERIGRLTFLAGWSLRANDRRFGGISGLALRDGLIFALGDHGILFRFRAPEGAGEAPSEGPVSILPLVQGPGEFGNKRDRDSEALALGPDHAWLSYETEDQIWRYRLSDWRAEARAQPAAMEEWADNRGAEALVRLRDGRFLAFAEDPAEGEDGLFPVLLFEGDPADQAPIRQLRYRAPAEHRVTDAAELPDGRILLLHRGFTLRRGWSARLTIARIPARGGRIEAEEVAALVSPFPTDNMEGLALTREGGRTIVWIASDDNFLPIQRTLLLKFALDG